VNQDLKQHDGDNQTINYILCHVRNSKKKMKKLLLNPFFMLAVLFGAVLFDSQELIAQAPPLREQVSLNGTWAFTPESGEETTIEVPEYWDAAPGFTKKVNRDFERNGQTVVREVEVPSTSTGIYEREITIPESWIDKIIRVEFEGINHIAEVYLNDRHLKTHIGGWIPFSVDITDRLKPGESGRLKVIVKGGDQQPIVDADGNPQWPVGWYGHQSRWGIIFDTWLRAYGRVYVNDVFIQTSWRQQSIGIDYELINGSGREQSFRILGEIRQETNEITEFRLSSMEITLRPGEKRTIRLDSQWEDPLLWTPETPDLYILTSSLIQEDNILDKEQRRFGFREIWIEGNELRFNGYRLNLRGTSINTHGQGYNRARYDYITPETWNRTIDRLQYLNIQCVRFHQQPPSRRIIEIADERGLLVIEESPMYARDYILDSDNEIYFANGLKWLKPWVKERRNHPSIIMWSSENEIGRNWLRWFSDAQLKTLADTIRDVDPTRPVIAEGDFDVGDDFNSLHYPEGVGKTVTGSIYSWDSLVVEDKPTGIGEFLFGNTDGKEWWHGTWSRGLRYVNVAQIMPYTLDWSWKVDSTTAVYENLKNSFAPVALFDREYDDLGIDALRKKEYPTLKGGTVVTRNLVLYNDDFSQDNIQVEVRLEVEGKILARDIQYIQLPLGEHSDITCELRVPFLDKGIMDLVLVTRKNGHLTFEEHKSFRIGPADENDMNKACYVSLKP
jgi:hypothetical protein